MSMKVLWGLLLSLIAVMAACAEAAPTPYPTVVAPTVAPEPTLNPEGDAGHGQALFTQWRCADCHGTDASGKIGPALAGTSLTLVQFTNAVRQTRPPKPAFSVQELSESDVRDVYVWAQALARPSRASEAVSLLPEGQILGMKLYTDSGCDRCHGAFAQGGDAGPVLVEYVEGDGQFLQQMQATAAEVPEHDLEALEIDPALMRRLHSWLQEGADPNSGC